MSTQLLIRDRALLLLGNIMELGTATDLFKLITNDNLSACDVGKSCKSSSIFTGGILLDGEENIGCKKSVAVPNYPNYPSPIILSLV
jgi:hypothetical protein